MEEPYKSTPNVSIEIIDEALGIAQVRTEVDGKQVELGTVIVMDGGLGTYAVVELDTDEGKAIAKIFESMDFPKSGNSSYLIGENH